MALESQEIIEFKPVPSVRPGEQGLHFAVPLSTLINKPALTVDVSTFAAAIDAQVIPSGVHRHASLAGHAVKDFVFKGWQDGPSGYMTAIFHRADKVKEASRKIEALSGPPFSMERPWPNVLIYLGAIEDPDETYLVTVGGSDVEVKKLFERVYLVPGGTYSSPVRREVYVSSRGKFRPELLETDVPVPGRLQWANRNLRGGLTCLHPRMAFEETQTGASQLYGWGTIDVRPPSGGARIILPPTEHLTWREHCFDVNVQRSDDGQWVLTRLIASPPKGWRIISGLSATS